MYKFITRVRSRILVLLTHNLALPLLKYARKPEVFPYSLEALESFPDGTMGKDLFLFLEKKNLALLPYYARHDMKHILLGYDTTEEGEVCLQCFMLGTRHISFPVLATVIYGVLTMPEHWQLFRIAWQKGKLAENMEDWNWFGLLHTETETLKKKLMKQ